MLPASKLLSIDNKRHTSEVAALEKADILLERNARFLLEDLRFKIRRRDETAPSCIRCSRQPEEDLLSRNSIPLLPRIFEVADASGRVLARRIVVELNPNIVKESCLKRIPYPCIGKRALRSRTQ